MTIFKKKQLLILLISTIIILNACGNSNASNKEANKSNNTTPKTEKNQQSAPKDPSKVQHELDKAKKAGRAVFVVITGNGSANIDKAIAIAKGVNGIYKNSVIVELNRDDQSNAQLVSQWRLAGAPLPLILVVSPKGFPVGGFILNDATAEKLVEIVPSPKMDNIYEAINSGKSVFIVVSKKSFTDKAKIIENCNNAVKQLQGKAVIVDVDLDDKKESGFIKQLNLKNVPNTTMAIVVNASGQTTGSFEGKAEISDLVLAANKIVRSSCCPGGSGASCDPKK